MTEDTDEDLWRTNPTEYLKKTADHPFRMLFTSFGMEVPIDEEIADLMIQIWKAEIDTLNSCQANPDKDWVWIEFDTAQDTQQFLMIVNENYKETDQSKSVYCRSTQGIWSDDLEWTFNALVFNHNSTPEEDLSDELEGNDVVTPYSDFHISVRFPKSDYQYVLDKLTAFNKKRELGKK